MGDVRLNLIAAHKHFSAECFNQAWNLIKKPDRTATEGEEMLRLSMASLWHWTQRPDCTATNLAVGYWQVARIYALLGQPENARRYGELSLESVQADGAPPFYLGYAYEALARAEMVAGNREQMAAYLTRARRAAEMTGDAEGRQLLLEELKTIQ